MPWASGAFSRIFGANGWVNDRDSSVFILATRHDTHDQDIADGINLCITKDGQSKPAATITPNLTNSYDWGSLALIWRNIYSATMRLVNSGFYTSFVAATLTNNRTVTVPDKDGIVAFGSGVIKTADTPRSGVIALADDPDLIIPLDASSKYEISVHFPFSDNWTVGTHPGIVARLGYSGTVTTYSMSIFGFINGSFVSQALSSNISGQFSQSVLTGSGTQDYLKFKGSIITNAAGNLSVQWCQFNNAGTTTSKAGAFLKVRKI